METLGGLIDFPTVSFLREETLSPVTGVSIFNSRLPNTYGTSCMPVLTTEKKTTKQIAFDSQRTSNATIPKESKFDIERLKQNPMFEDLTKVLAEECLHIQVPTNLMNIKWEAQDRATDVHSAHLNLQKRFLKFRADVKAITDARAIECRYSKEVSSLEVARYLETSSCQTQGRSRVVHERFDRCRLRLINDINKDLDKLANQEIENDLERSSSSSNESYTSADDTDILEKAMAAAEVLPLDLHLHHQVMPSGHISGLLESFDLPRHGVPTQISITQSTEDSKLQKQPRSSMKRKFEDHQRLEDVQQHKKQRLCPSSKGRLISIEATQILTNWYESHVQYPYPNDEEVDDLCLMTSLTVQQVKKWMANKRVRCFNTLSITGNKHPIKHKLGGKKKQTENNYKQLGNKPREILNTWFQEHTDNPYPSETEKMVLANATGLTVSQIKSWFANRRSRANNRRRQIPNYFLEKFPEYATHVQLIQAHRDNSRKIRPTMNMNSLQSFSVNCNNCFY